MATNQTNDNRTVQTNDAGTVNLTYDNPEVFSSKKDWRMASFSMILPLPDNGTPNPGQFIELGGLWKPGRFGGIEKIATETGETFTAYNKKATGHFGPGADSAMNAYMIDLPSFIAETKELERRTKLAKRFVGEARYYYRNDENITNLRAELLGGCQAQILAIEFSQFKINSGYLKEDFDTSLGESESSKILSVMICHFVIQNPTSKQLLFIANRIAHPVSSNKEKDLLGLGGKENEKLTDDYITKLEGWLNEGLDKNGGANFSFVMTPGGYLVKRLAKTDGSQNNEGMTGCRNVDFVQDGYWARPHNPFLVSCAIPWGEALPSHPYFAGEDKELLARQWAYSLATASNWFFIGQPNLLQRDDYQGDSFRFWEVNATVSGLGLVRKTKVGLNDPTPWILASTRFVDLALLEMRASTELKLLSRDLSKLQTNLTGNSSIEALNREFDEFLGILGELNEFRTKLWFEAFPGNPFETGIWKLLQKATGVGDLYRDVVDEASLRNTIYQVWFNTNTLKMQSEQEKQREEDRQAREADRIAIEDQREEDRRARQRERDAIEDQREEDRQAREADRIAIEDQREEDRRTREAERIALEEQREKDREAKEAERARVEKKDKTLNFFLAAVALFLGAPQLADSIAGASGLDAASWSLLLIVTGALIVVLVAAVFVVPHFMERNESKNKDVHKSEVGLGNKERNS